MEIMERKKPRPRRSFTPEFKAEIVGLCQRGDRSTSQVARDFDLTESTVRTWVNQAAIDQGERPGLTSEERQELRQLRHENRQLRMDNETADSTGRRNELSELLRWCHIAEGLARTPVEAALDGA